MGFCGTRMNNSYLQQVRYSNSLGSVLTGLTSPVVQRINLCWFIMSSSVLDLVEPHEYKEKQALFKHKLFKL